MPRLLWLPEAEQDMLRLHAFLADIDLTLADRALIRIYDDSEQLRSFPEIGRSLHDGTNRRELLVAFGRSTYIVRYVIKNETIIVARVWHHRESRN